MKLADFERSMDFPVRRSAAYVVYVFFFVPAGQNDGTPFYVGETGRFDGRMGDYSLAAFAASTDFQVGEAIRYLNEKGAQIKVGYKDCADRRAARLEEGRLIKLYKSQGFALLNGSGYDYRESDPDRERQEIREYCDQKPWNQAIGPAA